MPPVAHQKAAEIPKVTQENRYNTRARNIQGQDLMANHVETITTPTDTPSKPAPLMRPAGEDWAVIDQVTGKLTLEPGIANAVIYPKTGKSQEYQHLIKPPEKPKWSKGMSNGIGRIFQGLGDTQGTNTCFFIHRHEVPPDAKVTYLRIVCNIWPQKKEAHRVRLTVGREKITFDGLVSTPTSDLTTPKLHWNIVILTSGSKYLVVDVRNFYLNNAMSKHEYYKIAISLIPQDVIGEYNLKDKQINGFLYVSTENGTYGIFQAGIIEHTDLKEHLQPFRYESAPITPGLWPHNKNGTNFTLVVDKFWIKYQRKEDVLHLIHAPQEKY